MIYRMPIARMHTMPQTRQERPAMNILRDEDGLRLQFAVPGYRREELHLRVEEGHLVVEGKPAEAKTGGEIVRREFAPAAFTRKFRLDERIEAGAVEARVEHGVLEVTLRFKQPVRHEIAVA